MSISIRARAQGLLSYLGRVFTTFYHYIICGRVEGQSVLICKLGFPDFMAGLQAVVAPSTRPPDIQRHKRPGTAVRRTRIGLRRVQQGRQDRLTRQYRLACASVLCCAHHR